MGVLIGDVNWRGKAVFKEVFQASQAYLYENGFIERIRLGVAASNLPAVLAYKKVGFEPIDTVKINGDQQIIMEASHKSKNRVVI